jgi:uncharacterized protein YodC (DUF2158 family)
MTNDRYTQVADIERDDDEITIRTHGGSDLCETLEALGTSSFSLGGTAYGVVCESRRACSPSKEFKLRPLRAVHPLALQVGELVKLRSGGPRMTISHVSDDVARCMWWNGAAYDSALFSNAALKRVTE